MSFANQFGLGPTSNLEDIKIQRFDEIENEILNNDDFISGLMNKSLFENEKLIIISRLSEKILKIIELIIEKKME